VVPTAEEEQSLSLEDADELMLFAIVTIPKDPAQMSANLQGPLLINFSKKLGLQVVRPDGELRYPLLEGYKQCLLRERQKC
jgi:flagellar assembly factor FliW